MNEKKFMSAAIDLMKNNVLYVVKDSRLIEQVLPEFGKTVVVMMGGKVDRFEMNTKRKV